MGKIIIIIQIRFFNIVFGVSEKCFTAKAGNVQAARKNFTAARKKI